MHAPCCCTGPLRKAGLCAKCKRLGEPEGWPARFWACLLPSPGTHAKAQAPRAGSAGRCGTCEGPKLYRRKVLSGPELFLARPQPVLSSVRVRSPCRLRVQLFCVVSLSDRSGTCNTDAERAQQACALVKSRQLERREASAAWPSPTLSHPLICQPLILNLLLAARSAALPSLSAAPPQRRSGDR